MNLHIEKINAAIADLRAQIIHHKVYSAIKHIDDLKIFMQYHVFAVWDFMSLLKTLQNNLTCTRVPWFPVGSADTRYLINEIVVGEEADLDSFGNRKSHFELYLDAMQQCGADTNAINQFIDVLKNTADFDAAFAHAKAPQAAIDFVNFTFDIIRSHKPYLQAAIFTFGREDLIPSMFMSLVDDIHQTFPDLISIFKYYLERHIAVDGDQHSHLALQMTANLCGDNPQLWHEAHQATIEALNMRIRLWDGAYHQIIAQQQARH